MKKIIRKWYARLGFPTEWDSAFEALLEKTVLSPCAVEDYDHNADFARNLPMYLYFCEHLQKKYSEKGIDEKYLFDTLGDIVIWAKTHYGMHQSLGISETNWLYRHLTMKLIRLGRLQFCMAPAENGTPDDRISEGENVLEIHIPEGEKLDCDGCLKSIDAAKVFFAKHFPEFEYKYFTCHSWLLDSTLKKMLPEQSNILRFQKLFEVVSEDDSNRIIRYVFSWDMTEEKLGDAVCISSFAEKVKKHILSGNTFHESLGIIKK